MPHDKRAEWSKLVMAGLVPAIHAFVPRGEDVDARDKRGHGRCITP
jgi:hypothetical protein